VRPALVFWHFVFNDRAAEEAEAEFYSLQEAVFRVDFCRAVSQREKAVLSPFDRKPGETPPACPTRSTAC